ncbi:cytochrome P450 [Paraburkholderia tropica]|uniref:cytochrome P450 n=1 Tax=Paraburkholderia tropica TaxID=92647 RepID=UPI002AB7AD97|nr:cytochrome P450 [Paraburkholderia tropica]
MENSIENNPLPSVDWEMDEDLGRGAVLVERLEAQRAKSWGAVSRRGLEVFSYDKAAQILRSRDFYTPFGKLSDNSGLVPEDGWTYFHMERMLAGVKGPEHVKLKSIFLDFFGPRAVEKWRPHVADIVDRLSREQEGEESFDLAKVCLKLPAFLFCRLINKPDKDAEFLVKTSDEILKIFEQNPANRDVILQSGNALKQYTDALLRERKEDRGDDLISFLIGKQESGLLTDEELTHNVAMLLEASVDNTGNQFALTMMHLLSEPARWDRLVADPSRTVPSINESIRITPKVSTINRITARDTQIDGHEISAGTWVSISVIAAHRDKAGMPDADVFDQGRSTARAPLVFGGGMHLCLGMLLSMLELEEGIATLARKYPRMRLSGEPHWTLTSRNITVESMPVTVN